MIPGSVTQLLITLVLIVPGFVFQGVTIRVRGRTPGDEDLSTRVMRAIVASTMFALLYLAIGGRHVADLGRSSHAALDHVRWYAIAGFGAAFVLPALAALSVQLVASSEWWASLVERIRPKSWSVIDPRPSAWDVAFKDATWCFVRVKDPGGDWYAGWYGENSYASSWPDPRSLYVELSYHIDDRGKIGDPVVGSTGAVIDCRNAVLIELIVEGAEVGNPATVIVTDDQGGSPS